MNLEYASFFLLGIKGTAMANLAVMLKQMGKKVSGVDLAEEFITDATLKDAGITYSADFSNTMQMVGYDVVVYSAAHGGSDHPLVTFARRIGSNIVSQPMLIGEIVSRFQTSIAVAGCHGKTTTSSLLAYALQKLGKRPSYLIGAPPFAGGGGGSIHDSPYFVVEADEYGVHPPKDKTPKLLFLHPSIALCMNIDFDHPDVYVDIEETKKTFIQFFSQAKKVVLCADDPVIQSVLPSITKSKVVTYGTTRPCDYRIRDTHISGTGSTFALEYHDKLIGDFHTQLFGQKNILNVAGVVVVLHGMGFTSGQINSSLDGFTGAKRRMETVWTDMRSYIIDDYGHHPAEIAATIAALRARFPDRKLHVIFQPHTFSRTQEFKSEFIKVLATADYTYLLPIFASARENPAAFSISSADLAQEAKQQGFTHVTSYGDNITLLSSLTTAWQPGDVVLTLGAGDVYKLKNDIIKALKGLSSKQSS